MTYRIYGDWVVNEVAGCTCAMGPGGYYGAHEPHCGLEPVASVEDLRTSDSQADRDLLAELEADS